MEEIYLLIFKTWVATMGHLHFVIHFPETKVNIGEIRKWEVEARGKKKGKKGRNKGRKFVLWRKETHQMALEEIWVYSTTLQTSGVWQCSLSSQPNAPNNRHIAGFAFHPCGNQLTGENSMPQLTVSEHSVQGLAGVGSAPLWWGRHGRENGNRWW